MATPKIITTAAAALATTLISSTLYAAPAQQLIVEFREGAFTRADFNQLSLNGAELTHLREMALPGHHVYRLPQQLDSAALTSLTEALARDSRILNVESDTLMYPVLTPNDTQYSSQWHYFESTGGINAEAAWDKSTGAGVVVAVVDTGYVFHSDLDGNMLPGYDFIADTGISNDGDGRDADASDPGDYTSPNECYAGWPGTNSSWHGTHVAGTVAASTDNNTGVAGVAFDAQVMPIRVLGKCGGYISDIADGIVWASGGSVPGIPSTSTPAQVINMSLGGSGSCSSTYQSAIDQAVASGTTIVVAAGNSGGDANNYSPSSCDNVLVVAATDRNGDKAWYSNYGSAIDVAAPGGDTGVSGGGVLSTLNSGTTTPSTENYVYYQGTSMAAPHASGVAALLYATDPAATPAEVMTAIETSTRPLPGSCIGGCGSGIIDASAAIDAIDGVTPPPPVGGEETFTNLSGSAWERVFVAVNIPAGMTRLQVTTTGGTGDIMLSVNEGTPKMFGNVDCRSNVRNTNDENCFVNSPAAGIWYMGIRSRSAFSGVSMTVRWE